MRPADISKQIALVLVMTGAGMGQQFSFRHYGAAEGLQNLAILSLAQDGEGFVWAGTEAGLYRYDGTRFHLMGAAEGLPCTAEVHALHKARDGALWANTCSKFFRFDGQRFHAAAGVNEMVSRAQAMADGPDGQLVVATRSGLQELAPTRADHSFAARPYLDGAGPARLKAKGIFGQGAQLWFGCEDHLCVEENGRFREYGEAEGLPADSWDAIGATPDGTIWARSPSKLYRKPPGSGRFQKETPQIAPSMYWGAMTIAADRAVMLPTDKGVVISQGNRRRVLDETRGLRSSITSAVLEDRDGSLWIGLVGAGLARCLGCGEWESWTKAQGLPSNLVWNILRDKRGALWVATSMGLTRLAGQLPPRTWSVQDGLPGENVRWLGEAADGAIWAIAKPGGLARIDPAGSVRAVRRGDGLEAETQYRGLIDRMGRLWVAANTGIFRNDRPASSRQFIKVNPPGTLPRGAWSAAEDHQGTVWVIAPNELWRVRDGQWRRYQKADGLPTDNPYIIAVGPDDSLWLRHRFDAGVDRVEFQNDRIVRSTPVVRATPGSVDLTAFHGFDALGGFWRGTAKGASALRNGSWTQYGSEDGLVWDDCDGEAFWADSDGSVWIGTSGGLAHFRPRPGPVSAPAADPLIGSLEVRKQPRLVRVSFSSLQYKYEQLVRFAYRLDGGPWTETQERSLSIAALGPGRHRLEIRSQIRNGPFSAKLAVAEFYVEPLWWQSWWFRTLAVLLAACLIYAGVLWRHRALRHRNAALERAVGERTAELEMERARVLEQKQRADAASAAKGQFLANMSHEIRTPLNGLLGLTSLLGEIQDPAESQETKRLIRSSGQALLHVINEVLDFSKVEAGKVELDIAPFELRPALEQAVGLFRATAAQKSLRLSMSLAPELPTWVAGDEVRLRQVIQNLISNALKFTTAGEIALEAAVESQDETSSLIRIAVRDTGIGIPPDRIAQLFSAFNQADSSISRRYGGTGLGLAISKSLVKLMGGTIGVESQPGQGTTFRFTVRLGRAIAPSRSPNDGPPVSDLGQLRVLLAEDNRVNQIVGLKILQKFGISADIVQDGTQAVSAATQNTYDVILMDVQMPDMDGVAATRQIRARVTGDRQPFICGLSAHATNEVRELCERAGMDGYLTKPLDSEKLLKVLVERSAALKVPGGGR